ncbi:hypothetical protein [Aureispira anguillae]|uniref:Uncharacterized protein n=1 Tax=Aureispira anguillae TaxID=2864201 RepID=A0A916DU58_9BACT|nr:hypothetical protein [Aureispira anguillae]BDS12993.1 hypothetical protein AsAng_0037210 [Aureispira anguillae]BDS13056.1 hypothetical protein AsAng_0037840 [Aureispira anguillae]
MALAKTGVVGDIATGDISIDILGGGIGNHGVSGKDMAAIFGAQARAEAIQSAREREERRQRNKVLAISGTIISSLFLLFILYYFTTKSN